MIVLVVERSDGGGHGPLNQLSAVDVLLPGSAVVCPPEDSAPPPSSPDRLALRLSKVFVAGRFRRDPREAAAVDWPLAEALPEHVAPDAVAVGPGRERLAAERCAVTPVLVYGKHAVWPDPAPGQR